MAQNALSFATLVAPACTCRRCARVGWPRNHRSHPASTHAFLEHCNAAPLEIHRAGPPPGQFGCQRRRQAVSASVPLSSVRRACCLASAHAAVSSRSSSARAACSLGESPRGQGGWRMRWEERAGGQAAGWQAGAAAVYTRMCSTLPSATHQLRSPAGSRRRPRPRRRRAAPHAHRHAMPRVGGDCHQHALRLRSGVFELESLVEGGQDGSRLQHRKPLADAVPVGGRWGGAGGRGTSGG